MPYDPESVRFSAADDLICISQSSCNRHGITSSEYAECIGNKNSRRGRHQMKTRRRRASEMSNESNTPKYKRQDWRHQLPRIKAKMERHFAVSWADWQENLELEREEPRFLSVHDQYYLSGQREDLMEEWIIDIDQKMMDEFGAEMEFEMFHEYYGGRNSRNVRPYERDWDYYSPTDDFDYDSCYLNKDREIEVPDEWYVSSDTLDHVFEDYGNMDRDLDRLHITHSSHLRFTGRYRPTRRMLTSIAML